METTNTINEYRQIIREILAEYASIPYRYADLKQDLIVSEDQNQYLLITQGWENRIRVHACITHVGIVEDKIWIYRDGLEDGIANDLVRAGIPKNKIVIAFHPIEIRRHSEFAVS